MARRGFRKGVLLLALWGFLTAAPAPAGEKARREERLGAALEKEALDPRMRAYLLWRNAYMRHVRGEFEEAVRLFRRSIEVYPTAEGHTFLGWSLSHMGRIREAIGHCKKAISLDPEFGNPYNDIGVYLMELGRLDEAVPWLKKATLAGRYCCYQFPHYNLGRILLRKGKTSEAKREFQRSLEYEPNYPPAREALEKILARERRTL